MKHLILFLDGLAGEASSALDGRTPLEAAERPALDAIARDGRPAAVEPDPWGRPTTEDALAGLLVGLDPAVDPLGPAVLGAAARGSDPSVAAAAGSASETTARGEDDEPAVLLALDLVTVEAGVLLHADAGGLTDAEGRTLAAALAPLAAELGPGASVEPLGGHRLALRLPLFAAPDGLGLHPPEAFVGLPVADARPVGERTGPLRIFMRRAEDTLVGHELAELRREAGLPAPTHAWPWGPGRADRRLDLPARYEGRRFAIVGGGTTEAGLAALAGLPLRRPARPAADPEGPSAFVATVVAALAEADAVVAWWRPSVPPADAAGRAAAATAADRHVVGPLHERLAGDLGPAAGGWRLAVVAGPARAADGRLLGDPLMAAFAGIGFHGPLELPFVEASAEAAELRLKPGDDVLDYLLFGAGVRRPRRPRRRAGRGGPPAGPTGAVWAPTPAAAPAAPPASATGEGDAAASPPGAGGAS